MKELLLLSSLCIGPADATRHAIYLHGLEDPKSLSNEETKNRAVLERLGKELGLRFALPLAEVCKSGKRCWTFTGDAQAEATFEKIRGAAKTCGLGDQPYELIGFSNGGYYALKLFKVHKDPKLKTIIAFGSAGDWFPEDKQNPLSTFHLAIGDKDMTLKKAKVLATSSKIKLSVFSGGHRIDEGTLRSLLESK